MRKTTLLLCSAAFLFTASSAHAGIKGSVSYKGKASAKAIDMSSDPKCKKLSPDAKSNDLVVNGGKVQDVFVYVKNPPKGKYKAPKTKAKLDQKGCRYIPKVLGVMKKQKIEIINSDPTLHNVHAFAKRGEFNQAMPKQGQKITKKFKKAQVMVPIKCDVHSWMEAYVGVMEHPFFATSGSDGSFEIPGDGLKDGEYEVVFWHKTLGEKTAKVKVAGGNGALDFGY
ncbi:MAG: hypothetical protein RIT81_33595 [Deltaproteobacteria bacterium]